MLDGYKTFIIALMALVGSFVLILKGILPADAWWQTVTPVAGMVGAREFADKFKT